MGDAKPNYRCAPKIQYCYLCSLNLKIQRQNAKCGQENSTVNRGIEDEHYLQPWDFMSGLVGFIWLETAWVPMDFLSRRIRIELGPAIIKSCRR